MKNLFIAFEGIDGSGKDTQLMQLAKAIKEDDNYPFGNKYSNIWITRNPTKITESGIKISNLLRSTELSKEDATKYFIKDRIEHSKIINNILEHSHILSSRYDFSTLLYQMTQGMDFEDLYALHKYGEEGCRIPDITIIFDIPTDVAISRMSLRDSEKEVFEKEEFLEKLNQNLNICINKVKEKDNRKFLIVNSNQSIDKVTEEMLKKINDYLNEINYFTLASSQRE